MASIIYWASIANGIKGLFVFGLVYVAFEFGSSFTMLLGNPGAPENRRRLIVSLVCAVLIFAGFVLVPGGDAVRAWLCERTDTGYSLTECVLLSK